MKELKKYWVSWWMDFEKHGAYELYWPWWVTGEDREGRRSICAAIKSLSKELIIEEIYQAYDKRPEEIEFRFIEEKDDDWVPYSDRFPKPDWYEEVF